MNSPSQNIKGFVEYINSAKFQYQQAEQSLKTYNDILCDLEHYLEFTKLTYAERAKLATKIKSTRLKRRAAKDTIAKLQPLIDYLEKYSSNINFLDNLWRQMKNIEDGLSKRSYMRRSGLNIDNYIGRTEK